ncbi:hypothetical protein SAMD00019534_030320 [Acytostelium subglobosum LB1]|uniref:hypothetical protein n=1 Tax=Acytostelium subglobosum LB1 TaxID=1410327 RepID=UPI0006447E5B|nr:hypothetical protein SAMD00019534_030320 [Acytostelium subglobosum LB1]GAM19857.1 hypothetical protein SAMD00019534_030320 [Acytostelium subglobosum LB1]|eukprot:XP_012756619.1 hypothetical protein SAMD00019534_030320 [Acytostelium subglobosum LB1]
MPFVVFKHVYDTNRYNMLYHHPTLIATAASAGRLDVYKVFEAQSKDYPLAIPSPDKYNDHLMYALYSCKLSMFEHLLALETYDTMSHRVKDPVAHHYNQLSTTSRRRTLNERIELAAIIKKLIKYTETYYVNNQITPIRPHHVIRAMLKDPFSMILECEDIELARQAIKYAPFDQSQLFKHCSNILGYHNWENILYTDIKKKIDQEQLKRGVDFLFELMILYDRPVIIPTHTLFPACKEVLTEVGVMILNVYAIMSPDSQPALHSIIRKSIFTNVRPSCDPLHLKQFIRYLLSLNNKKIQGLILTLDTICAFGTVEMLKIVHELLVLEYGLKVDHIRLNRVFPKSLEMLEYILEHNMYTMDNMAMLAHFSKMGNPDMLKTFFARYPGLLDVELDRSAILQVFSCLTDLDNG